MKNGEQPATGFYSSIGHYSGLTKREEFAKAAMQAMLANSSDGQQGYKPYGEMHASEIANIAVDMADALLKALEPK